MTYSVKSDTVNPSSTNESLANDDENTINI